MLHSVRVKNGENEQKKKKCGESKSSAVRIYIVKATSTIKRFISERGRFQLKRSSRAKLNRNHQDTLIKKLIALIFF